MKKILFLLSLLIVGFVADAQKDISNYTWYRWFGRHKFDSTIRVPLDTFASSPAGSLAFKGNKFWVKDTNLVWNEVTFGGSLSGYVPTSRTITINGTTYDLSANRTWTLGISSLTGLSDSLLNKANINGSNAYGTWPIGISGNSATVTNGVYVGDTASKWVGSVYRRSDSVFYKKGSTEYFGYKDSTGGGTPSLMKNVTLEFPSATENFGFAWKTPVAITVTSVDAVLLGSSSPSVTFQIAFDSDRSAAGTNVYTSGRTVTSTTTGTNYASSFNDVTIPAGSWIWITTSAQSGTVNAMELMINYTED